MIYSINTLLWSDTVDENLIPIIEQIHAVGYSGIEFPLFGPDLAKCRVIGQKAAELGLYVTSCTCRDAHDNPASPDKTIRQRGIDENKRILDCSAALGSKKLIGPYHTGIGCFTGKPVTEDEWKWTAESMREIAEHAKSLGIMMALECVNRFETYFINTIEDGLRFIRTVDHPNYRLMFDTFHANIEEKSMAKALELLTPEDLIHVHISANDRSTPCSGNIQWEQIFAPLKMMGYDETLCVEAFGNSLPKIAAATKIWRKMYESETQLMTDALDFMKRNWAN
ncbi:MAG: sugar phosphate isomerase/epimerase [Planctomycetaceae bacterium]|nr:sugar phosphate isomerase/epimerase [Planctomycetaceae bacterium]